MDLIVTRENDAWQAQWAGKAMPCAIGRSGTIDAADKREGDGMSPLGAWPMRRLLYRADRLAKPSGRLPASTISEQDGWCDAPESAEYNRPVLLPFAASHERLWREDQLYDVIVVLGHNDDPVRPGMGSAIFLHCAQPDFAPTEGCVALEKTTLISLLEETGPGDRVVIGGPAFA